MRKNIKFSISFLLMSVMFVATALTVTAYADTYGGTGYPNGGHYDEYYNDAGLSDLPETPYTPEPNGTGNTNNGLNANGNLPNDPPIQELPQGSLVIINSTHDGHLLTGAVFAVYRVGENIRLAELATNTVGRTQEIPLPQGNYYIVSLIPAHGHMIIVDRFSTSVTAGQRQEITIFHLPIPTPEPTPQPTPQPTPEPTPPPVEQGRLLVTLRAHGTGELLSGAIFELRRAMDNELVTILVTDSFGEAAVNVPIGDFFLREIEPARGFVANPDRINVRIAANRLNEVNITSRPIPQPEPTPTPTPQPQPTPQPSPQPTQPPVETGRLLITLRAHDTGEFLREARFELRRTMDNEVVATLITDNFGEAAVNVPIGDYFLREVSTARGFIPNPDRINVRIAADRINEINLTSRPEPLPEPPQPEQEAAAEQNGRLLITATSAETGERQENVSFTVHHVMTDEIISIITTNRFGEASINLPQGDYFLRKTTVPFGYDMSMDRIGFTIRSGIITDRAITTTPLPPVVVPILEPTPDTTPPPAQTHTPPTASTAAPVRPATPSTTQSTPATQTSQPRQGQVQIVTRAEQSGNPVFGVTFGVYRASDNQRITEITTNVEGMASLDLPTGEYFLRNYAAPLGFNVERARIFFTVTNNGNVRVDITMQRDWSVPYVEYGIITLPQTGELLPIMNYVLGALFVAAGILLIVKLWKQGKSNNTNNSDNTRNTGISSTTSNVGNIKQNHKKRRGVIDYA